MNILMFFLICILSLEHFIALSTGLFSQLNSASQDFEHQMNDCPQEARDFWDNPKPDCIPPPTDHAAFYVPPQGATPALCLFINRIAEEHRISLIIRDSQDKELQCQYL